jgi:hypothetical protein
MKGEAQIFQNVSSINKLKFRAEARDVSINTVEVYVVDSLFVFYIQEIIYFLCCGLDDVVRQEIHRQSWSCCNP